MLIWECAAGVGCAYSPLFYYWLISPHRIWFTALMNPTNKSVDLATPQLVAPASYPAMPCHARYVLAYSLLCHLVALSHCSLVIRILSLCYAVPLSRPMVVPVHVIPLLKVATLAPVMYSVIQFAWWSYLECATSYLPLPVISYVMPCRTRCNHTANYCRLKLT